MRSKEFMSFQFTTLDWSNGSAQYIKELLSQAVKIAQVLKPGLAILLSSDCDVAGNIKWV